MKLKTVGATTAAGGSSDGGGVAITNTKATNNNKNNNTTTSISSNSNSTKSTIHSISDHDSSNNSYYNYTGSEHSTNSGTWSNSKKNSNHHHHHRHSHTKAAASGSPNDAGITATTATVSSSQLLFMELLNLNPTSDEMKFDEKRFVQLITTYPEICTKKYKFDIYNMNNTNSSSSSNNKNTSISDTKKSSSSSKSKQQKKDDTMDDNDIIDSKDFDLLYPLHMICAVGGSLAVVKQVYKIFPSAVDYCSSGRNLSCLHCAAMYTRASIDVIQFLFRKMTILNSSGSNSITSPKTTSYQQTPLHLACLCPPSKTFHNPQVVMILTELGGSSICADVDRYGRTPLHIACSIGQQGGGQGQGQGQSASSSSSVPSLSIIQDLTEVYSKACVVQCTKYQATPLHIICSNPKIADGTCTVMVDIMKDLLRTNPMATQMNDWKDEIPIQIAIQNHVTYKICKMLLRKYPECTEMKFRYNPPIQQQQQQQQSTPPTSATTKALTNSKVTSTAPPKPQPLSIRMSTTGSGSTNSRRLGRITETDDDTTNNDDENDDPTSFNTNTTKTASSQMMMSLYEIAKLYKCSQDVIDLLNPYEEVLVDDEE